jgi:predicted MPP superfamily phosphohydrolase
MTLRAIAKTVFRSLFYSLVILLLVGVPCLIDGFLVEPNFPRIIRQEVSIPNLPKALDGLKMVQLSDLHIVKYGKREARALKLIRRIRPDLICLTGDYIGDDGITPGDYSDQYCIGQAARFMRSLSARYGVYGVSGNWDPPEIVPALERVGVRMIDKKSVTLKIRGTRLVIAGTPAPIRSLVEKGKHTTTIVLDHFPEAVDEVSYPHSPVDLLLAGHWHGGQVGWPLKIKETKYPAGLYKVGSTQLYVNRGLGMHSRAVRFNCPSEVTLVVLKRAATGN